MTEIVVDLDAYIISDEHRVYKCSPGKTYRFYREVRRSSSVFLDIRGLPAATKDGWDDKKVLKAIADDRWDREVESRARGNQPVGSQGIGKSDRTRLGFLKGLLFDAQKGDLVVVPVDGYNKDVLVGELVGSAGDIVSVEANDDEQSFVYLGRKVKWRAALPKRFLSDDLIKALHTQTAFFQIKSSLYEEIYRLAFGNFIYKNNYIAEFKTSKDRFTAEDTAVVSTWINGLDVLQNQIDGKLATSAGDTSFYVLGLTALPDNLAAEVKINIQSPGEIFVKSKRPFALGLMAMFALAGCDPQAVVDNGVTVKLKTVGEQSGTSEEISDCVNAMAIALRANRLHEACGLSARAEKDAKMSTEATLKIKSKKTK